MANVKIEDIEPITEIDKKYNAYILGSIVNRTYNLWETKNISYSIISSDIRLSIIGIIPKESDIASISTNLSTIVSMSSDISSAVDFTKEWNGSTPAHVALSTAFKDFNSNITLIDYVNDISNTISVELKTSIDDISVNNSLLSSQCKSLSTNLSTLSESLSALTPGTILLINNFDLFVQLVTNISADLYGINTEYSPGKDYQIIIKVENNSDSINTITKFLDEAIQNPPITLKQYIEKVISQIE